MSSYIKGKLKRDIFKAETGYRIGLFKVIETSDDLEE